MFLQLREDWAVEGRTGEQREVVGVSVAVPVPKKEGEGKRGEGKRGEVEGAEDEGEEGEVGEVEVGEGEVGKSWAWVGATGEGCEMEVMRGAGGSRRAYPASSARWPDPSSFEEHT